MPICLALLSTVSHSLLVFGTFDYFGASYKLRLNFPMNFPFGCGFFIIRIVEFKSKLIIGFSGIDFAIYRHFGFVMGLEI